MACVLSMLSVRGVAQDLCAGFVTNTSSHPRTAGQPIPALGVLTTDPDLGAKFRRITDVVGTGANPFIKPLYSPVAAWNIDESYLLLYQSQDAGGQGWWLYNGMTYAKIKSLPISPSDIEQVWWDATDPHKLYYPTAGEKKLYSINTETLVKTVIHDFTTPPSSCTDFLYGESHAGTSWDSTHFVLACGDKRISYYKPTDTVLGVITWPSGDRGYPSPSGQYIVMSNVDTAFTVFDDHWNALRTLDIHERSHNTLDRTASGRDTYNIVEYDPGPLGSKLGSLVVHYLDDATNTTMIGPVNGYPYPKSNTHISGTAFKRPGWLWESHIGGCPSGTWCPNANPPNCYQGLTAPQLPCGQDVLDNEITITDTNTGKTCRVMHHHATGTLNTHLTQPYWAEPHVTASPSGTRAVFASDWENGTVVNTYVIETPAFSGGGAVTVPTATLASGITTEPYSVPIPVSGGTGPYTCTRTAGVLPQGLSLNCNCSIFGTPTTVEVQTFTIQACDSTLACGSGALTIPVLERPTVTTSTFADGFAGQTYAQQAGASGGTTPYAYSIAAGSLPTGLTMNAAGAISGIPTLVGTYGFTLKVASANGLESLKSLSILVKPNPTCVVVP